MGNLNPQLKEIPDYKQKLWEKLFIISNFELDVESPYPIPTELERNTKPERLPYNKERSRFKQYGYNIQLMVEQAIAMPDGPDKMSYINLIANTMKLFLRSMDREAMPESVISAHMAELSEGKLQVNPEDIHLTKYIPPKNPRSNASASMKRSKNKNKHKGGKRRKKSH